MITIDTERSLVILERNGARSELPFTSPEAFREIAKIYLRVGWDTKYVYSFSWLGRPIIQLPDDLLRLQEVIYAVQPDCIVEIGVAHGGSLVFLATLLHAIGKGKVVGVDIEIRPHNRSALERHRLYSYMTLLEGDSVSPETVGKVRGTIGDAETVMVLLDGNHAKSHVAKELAAYAPLVSKGSYIVAMDGIMQDLADAPRASADWATNNPVPAIREFVAANPDFAIEEPIPPFNEGAIVERTPTYWPSAFIKRLR